MKNRYLHISALITVLTLCTQSVNAQQGFGTNQPHKSAAIDIKSNSRGLLIPRVTLSSLTSQSPIATPVAEGLLVYNIGDSSDTNYNVDKGFYYWYNGKWNSFLTSLNSESTDDQVIESFEITSDHKLKIKIEGDSDTHEVNLAPYVNKSYTLSSSGNNMILSVDGIALTPAASIISNNTLSIENGTNNAKNLQSSVNGELSSIDITNLIRTEQITYSLVDGTNTTAELVTDTANAKSYRVNVAPATSSSLGVVKPGEGLSIDTDGILNVDFPVEIPEVITQLTDVQVEGKVIGKYTNESNVVKEIKETVTNLTYENNQLVYTNENGTQAPITIVGEDTKSSVVTSNTTTVDSPVVVAGVIQYKVEVNPLQGDVTGTINATRVEKIQGTPVSTTTPNVGQVLVATSIEDGTAVGWVPTTISATDTKTTVSGANGVLVTPTVNTQDTSSTDYKVAVKYAMPQVFYMPAMLFNAQAGQTYSDVDLYAHYVDQFATPFKSSAGASGMIPHVAAATQLEYYITYADPSILPNSITITADGKLTYSVGTGSQESFAYMTVVFVVKPNAVITVPASTP